MKHLVIGSILGLLVTGLIAFFFLPVLSFHSLDLIFILGVFAVVGLAGGFIGQDVKAINYTHVKVFASILIVTFSSFMLVISSDLNPQNTFNHKGDQLLVYYLERD